MKNFEGFGLSQTMLASLSKMDYSEPTPIQQKAIPLALDGRDVLGSAQTGTGKTAAFGIPLVEKIINSTRGSAIVMTPTRELAKQVSDVIHQLLGYKSEINTAFLIGGAAYETQMRQLKARPRIIVGTPGRINDHLERGSLKLHDTSFLVLDETDRMLDMGFGVQIDRILKHMPAKRQTLMFSATIPKEIVQMSGKYLTNPERIAVGASNVVATNIKQEVIQIDHGAKYNEMIKQLHARNGSVLIFVKTKYGTERMAKNLNRDGFDADALHGDLRQRKRDKVMQRFRNKKFRILVATDIAARGLDVPHIEHVINHDLPQVAEDYIHRMGRTARAGAGGSALSFVCPPEMNKWRAIERLLDPSIKQDRNTDRKSSNGSSKRGRPRRSGGGNKFGRGDDKPYGKKFANDSDKPKRKNKFKRGERPTRDDTRNGGPDDGKRFERDDKPAYGKKPYAKKPFRKDDDETRSNDGQKKRTDFTKPSGKKPFVKGKSANKSGGNKAGKPGGVKKGGKTGFRGKDNKPATGGYSKGPKKNGAFKKNVKRNGSSPRRAA